MSDAGNEATLDIIADRLFDTWERRSRGKTARDIAQLRIELAALKAEQVAAQQVRVDRDREIRGIKDTVEAMDSKIDKLVVDNAVSDTTISNAKWLVGTGFLGIVGSVVLATLHYIGVRWPLG